MMNTPSCRICNNFFSFKDYLRTGGGSRIPLLLSCGHAICDGCVRAALSRATAADLKKKKSQVGPCSIECGDCKQITEVNFGGIVKPAPRNAATFHVPATTISDEILFKLMPVDFYTLGLLVTRRKEAEKRGDGIEFMPTMKKEQVKKKNQLKKSGVSCEECQKVLADLFCKDCGYNYCTSCFKKSHITRIFSSHQTQPVLATSVKRCKEGKICVLHKKRMEFFCKDDQCDTCSECAITGEHKGHNLLNIMDKIKQDSENAYTAGHEARKRIAYSLKCLQSLGPELKRRSSDGLEIIRNEILKQIRNLQLLELCTTKSVELRTEKQIENAEKIVEDLMLESAKLESLMSEVEASFRNPPADATEFNSIIAELEEYADFPSLLSSEFLEAGRSELDVTRAVQISVELASLRASVKEYVEECTENILGESIRLVRPSELNDQGLVHLQRVIETQEQLPTVDKFIPADIPSTSVSPDPRPTSAVSRPSSSLLKVQEGVAVSSVSPPVKGLFADEYQEDFQLQKKVDKRNAERKAASQNQKIVVCHINDPGDFCVQKVSDRSKYIEREIRFNAWAEKLGPGEEIPEEVQKGGIYLAKSELYNTWYRAQVLVGCGCYSEGDDEEGVIYQVLYIDYGNTEQLEDRRLRNLPDEFKSPGIAIKCALEDLVPSDEESNQYSREAIEDFKGYALMGSYDMLVYRKAAGVLYVDFGRPLRSDIVEDGVASVRDAMVWLKHGKFVNPHPVPKLQVSPRRYFTLDAFPKDIEHFCIFGHVESPSELYLQLWTNEDKTNIQTLQDISYEMQSFFATDAAANLNFFSVQKGVMCAALFQDKLWYRAIVLEALPHRKARVLYVDYGNTWTVPLTFIRKIPEKFTDLPAQAVRCKLLDIAPVQPDGKWTPAAKNRLTELTDNKFSLACTIDTVELATNDFGQSIAILSIVLEERGLKVNTCINALFVEEKHAISTGPSSRIARHRKPGVEESISIQPQQRQVNLKVASHVDKREREFKLRVKIEHVDDLNHIYMSLQGDTIPKVDDKSFTELMNSTPQTTSVEDLKKAKKVAYYEKSSRFWRRATILDYYEVNGTIYAKIHLIDVGPTLNVPALELKLIGPPRYSKVPSLAHCVALAGVDPPGCTGKWPETSVEFFRENFLGQELLCQKLEGLPNKSYRVRLYQEVMVQAGPFDPPIHTERSVARELVMKGFALPNESYDEMDTDDFGSALESLETACDPEEVEEAPELKDWVPALPFKNKEFRGCVTWVGMECDICIQDLEEVEDNLSMLSRLLTLKYQDTTQKPYDLYYSKGDVCIARFSNDGCWYRGRIIDKSPEEGKYDVEFVDYGNEEAVEVKDLRKNTFMEDMPIQNNRCELYNIASIEGDKWTYDVLTYIHQTIVDKTVRVTVHNFGQEGERPQVSLILEHGDIHLTRLLVTQSLARWKSDPIVKTPPRRSPKPASGDAKEITGLTPKYDLAGFENYLMPKASPPKATYKIAIEACLDVSDSDDDDPFMLYERTERVDEEDPIGPLLAASSSDYMRQEMELIPEEPSSPLFCNIPSIFGSWKSPGVSLVPVEVSAVHDPTTIFVQPRFYSAEEEEYFDDCTKEWTSRIMPFIELSKTLNISGPRLSQLTNYEVGSACVAPYTDGNWYRGIIGKDGAVPIVYFTDFGNHQPITKENIRLCPPSLAEMSPYGTYATLDRIKFNEICPPSVTSSQSYIDLVNETLMQVLMSAKERLWARFKVCNDSVYVDLFDFRSTASFSDLPLAYDLLIQDGYFSVDE